MRGNTEPLTPKTLESHPPTQTEKVSARWNPLTPHAPAPSHHITSPHLSPHFPHSLNPTIVNYQPHLSNSFLSLPVIYIPAAPQFAFSHPIPLSSSHTLSLSLFSSQILFIIIPCRKGIKNHPDPASLFLLFPIVFVFMWGRFGNSVFNLYEHSHSLG